MPANFIQSFQSVFVITTELYTISFAKSCSQKHITKVTRVHFVDYRGITDQILDMTLFEAGMKKFVDGTRASFFRF